MNFKPIDPLHIFKYKGFIYKSGVKKFVKWYTIAPDFDAAYRNFLHRAHLEGYNDLAEINIYQLENKPTLDDEPITYCAYCGTRLIGSRYCSHCNDVEIESFTNTNKILAEKLNLK